MLKILNDGYQRGLVSIVYKFFDKKLASLSDKSVAGGSVANNDIKQNLQPANELHEQIIRKLKKRKVYSGIKDNIWGAYLADMKLISKFNKGFRFLLCDFDIFSKYTWVVPLRYNGANIVNAVQKILKEPDRKPNKIWVDKGSEFYKIIILKCI